MKIKSKKFQGVYIYPSKDRPGDECYYINYRDLHGKVVNEKVGWKSEGYTQDQANTVRVERVHAARHGKELPGKSSPIPTFDEAFVRWFDYQTNKGIVGVNHIRGIYGKHLQPIIGKMKLTEVTSDTVNKLSKGMAENGSRPGTVMNVHYIIRATFKHAALTGGFQGENPMVRVPSPKARQMRRERILSKQEAQELLQGMKAHGEGHYLFTAVGLFTGMRYSEIVGVTGKDIDHATSTIRVHGKGNKIRYVEVPPDLMKLIQEKNLGHNDKLVHGVDKWNWRRIVDKLGFNKDVAPGDRIHSVSAHTLRHTYGSWLAADGTPITVIKELMGHTDISTTMRYLKNAPRAGASYAARLTDNLL
jgi:integrase